jgi:choline-glycine betaine transporter
MQPVIALFAPFALIFFYKATKRNLFRHFQRPGYHYATTNNSVDVILLFAMLFFGIGCLFVNNENEELEGNQNGTRIINIIIIIIACIFLIIVPFRIFYCCIP